MPTRRLAAILLVVLAAACGSKTARTSGPRLSPQGDALLRRVPADTPYLVAVLEPMPAGYMKKEAGVLRQLDAGVQYLDGLTRQAREAGLSVDQLEPEARLVFEAVAELGGRITPESLARIGIGADLRGVLYAVDLLPVAHLLLSDGAKLRAAVDRVVAKAGYQLPVVRAGGREYWLFPA